MPKIVDHDQYRKELLGKAFDLFAAKGYASVTMRQIAQGIGVSTGTLYHYFPTKESLFEQLIEEVSQQNVLLAIAALGGAQTVAERMDAIAKFMANHEDRLLKQTYLFVDFCQHYGSDALQNNPAYRRAEQRYQQECAKLLNISDPIVVDLVHHFLSGLIINRLYADPSASFKEQLELFGKMLAAYLDKEGAA
ncbi:MAG TPA: TetR/AcrR family transcriptional regulator [Crinalium sp.]|jgi:AcrR family transcriptional regulator